MKLTPINNDPFASKQSTLTPVSTNPFTGEPVDQVVQPDQINTINEQQTTETQTPSLFGSDLINSMLRVVPDSAVTNPLTQNKPPLLNQNPVINIMPGETDTRLATKNYFKLPRTQFLLPEDQTQFRIEQPPTIDEAFSPGNRSNWITKTKDYIAKTERAGIDGAYMKATPHTPVTDILDFVSGQSNRGAKTPEAMAKADVFGVEQRLAREQGISLKAFQEKTHARTGILERGIKDVGSGAVSTVDGLLGYTVRLTGDHRIKTMQSDVAKKAFDLLPADPNFFDELAVGFGSTASFFVPGMGIARGINAFAQTAPRMALWLGASASAGMEAATEAGAVYTELRQRGLSHEQASRRADKTFYANTVLVTVTNKMGLFSGVNNKVLRRTLAGVNEGVLQEAPQQVISNLATDKPWYQGTAKAALIGSIIGTSLAGSMKTPTETVGDAINQEIQDTELPSVDVMARSSLSPENATLQVKPTLIPVQGDPFANSALQTEIKQSSPSGDYVSKSITISDQATLPQVKEPVSEPDFKSEFVSAIDQEPLFPPEKKTEITTDTKPWWKYTQAETIASIKQKKPAITDKELETAIEDERWQIVSEYEEGREIPQEVFDSYPGLEQEAIKARQENDARIAKMEAYDRASEQREQEKQKKKSIKSLRASISKKEIQSVIKKFKDATTIEARSNSDNIDPGIKIPKTKKLAVKKLQTAISELEAELQERITTHNKIRENGLDALSDYDITLSSNNDPTSALETALELTRNHVSYTKTKLQQAKQQLQLQSLESTTSKPVKANKPKKSNIKSSSVSASNTPTNQSDTITDFGEKIGGARKDTDRKRGSRIVREKDKRPSWARRYDVHEVVSDNQDEDAPGKFTVFDSRTGRSARLNYKKTLFTSRLEAEQAIPLIEVSRNHRVQGSRKKNDGDPNRFEIIRQVTERKRPVIKDGFTSRDEAMTYLAKHAVEIIETKTRFDDSIHPALKKSVRLGEARRDNERDITAQDFNAVFGFRGVEFGNWNNSKERQHILNQGFDALLDLADMLGIPPTAISLNGDLAIGFGSRGHGLIGAKAHYERHYAVINLTKIKGAGSLAHEWMHAFDHYLGRQSGKAKSEKVLNKSGDKVYPVSSKAAHDYVSHGFGYRSKDKVREELQTVFNTIIEQMKNRQQEYTEDTSTRERIENKQHEALTKKLELLRKSLAKDYSGEQYLPFRGKKNNLPATNEQLKEFDKIIKKILSGKVGNLTYIKSKTGFGGRSLYDTVKALSDLHKKIRGRQGYTKDRGVILDIQWAVTHERRANEFLTEAREQKKKTRTVATEYYSQAWRLDQGGTKDYWSTPHEMLARAFESYIYDKLKSIEARNDFLAYEKHNDLPEYKLFKVKPYPEGTERENLNKSFDALFTVLKSKKTDKGTSLYSRRVLDDSTPQPGLTVSDVEQVIAPIIKRWGASAPIVTVVEQSSELPPNVVSGNRDSIEGIYYQDDNNRSIYLVSQNIESQKRVQQVLAHESVGHFSLPTMMSQQSYTDLLRQIQTLKTNNDPVINQLANEIRQRDATLNRLDESKEILAVMAETKIEHSLLTKVKMAIKAFLRKMGFSIAFNKQDIETLLRKAAQQLSKESINTQTNFTSSSDTVDNITKAHKALATTKEVVSYLKHKTSDWRPVFLASLSRRMIADIGSDVLPQLKAYVNLAQTMDAQRSHLVNEAAEVATNWAKYYRQNKASSDAMATLMHDATVAGVDPAETYKPIIDVKDAAKQIAVLKQQMRQRSGDGSAKLMRQVDNIKMKLAMEKKREQIYPSLQQRYARLPSEAQTIYKNVREFYQQRFKQTHEALNDRIERSDIHDKQKVKLKNKIRQAFEQAQVSSPYFPLARFGEYWVSAKKTGNWKNDYRIETDREKHTIYTKNGRKKITSKDNYQDAVAWVENAVTTREFNLFESSYQQQQHAKQSEAKGFEVTTGKKIENVRALHGASESFVTDVIGVVNEAGGTIAEDVADTIYQLYLTTLPELSVRKHFIHRNKTKGYSQDALRAFAKQNFHGSYQLAKLQYADQLEHALDVMREAIPDSSDANKAADLVNEIQKRHEWAMNPKSGAWANVATSIGFAWYLGLTPSAALVNMTQTPLVALPIMASQFGFNQSSRALLKASKDYFASGASIKKGMFSVTKKLRGDERRAIASLEDEGVIDKTQGHDLASQSETPSAIYGDKKAKVMEIISFSFHHAERFNREVTALASYRLARTKGSSHEQALQTARDITWDSHFDYSNANKARFMQSDTARVLLLFRQYSLNMTYLLARNTQLALVNESKAVRVEARRKLAGIMGMHFLAAGSMGLPLFWLGEAILNSIFDDDDEPWDFKTEYRKFLADYLGDTAADAITVGSVQALSDVGLHSRVSLNELWFRSSDRDLEGKALANYWLEQFAGPLGAIPVNVGRGFDLMNEGQTWRGIEAATPKAIKDAMKALRYADEGVKNLKGDDVIDEPNVWQIFQRAIGFTPGEISKQYDVNGSIIKYKSKVHRRRQLLIGRWWLALRTGDKDGVKESLTDIRQFNKKNARNRITAKNLKASLKTRYKRRQQTRHGLYVPKRDRYLLNNTY